MIPYMVGKLVPNPTYYTRGLVKYVPGRGYLGAVPSQTGTNLLHPLPPQSLNGSIGNRLLYYYWVGLRPPSVNVNNTQQTHREMIGEGGGQAEKRKKTRRVVDAMWETGETWVKREENVDRKGLVP